LEVAANFILPGLGGLLFGGRSKKNAIWQMVLSGSGMGVAIVGCGIFMRVFIDSSGLHMDEEYVSAVLQNPEQLFRLFLGLGGVILGGILILGGFLWSLENAMKRWRFERPEPEEERVPSETK